MGKSIPGHQEEAFESKSLILFPNRDWWPCNTVTDKQTAKLINWWTNTFVAWRENNLLSPWQVGPWNPSRQIHVKESNLSTQDPPLWHGLESHSFNAETEWKKVWQFMNWSHKRKFLRFDKDLSYTRSRLKGNKGTLVSIVPKNGFQGHIQKVESM